MFSTTIAMGLHKIKRVWFTNMSESSRPLLSLSLRVDIRDHKDAPLQFTDHSAFDKPEEEWHYNLSFLSPDDLIELRNAIDLAIKGEFNNSKMNELTKQLRSNEEA